MIELSGVRSSCDMAARKRDWDALALSASVWAAVAMAVRRATRVSKSLRSARWARRRRVLRIETTAEVARRVMSEMTLDVYVSIGEAK